MGSVDPRAGLKRLGSWAGAGVFLPQLTVGSPQSFIMRVCTGEGETGGWETRRSVGGEDDSVVVGGCRGLCRGDETLWCV